MNESTENGLMGIATPDERAMIALMSTSGNKDPLHGITLERIVTELVETYGWDDMAARIPVRCFQNNPTIKSSLTFLRKTPWARQKVERWYASVLAPRDEM